MTSIRLPEAGAFALARVEVVANRRPARTPRMRATRAIAATVDSVKGVLKNLDIPYSFFAGCLYPANSHASTMPHAKDRGYTRVFIGRLVMKGRALREQIQKLWAYKDMSLTWPKNR